MRFVKIISEMCDVRFATGKSALYFTSSYVSINRKNSEEITKWEKRSFQRFVFTLEKRKPRLPSYWVLLLKPYRVSNRAGGTSLFMQNVRLCFFWPQRSCRRRTNPVG
jgi:hypothetical protein